MSKAWAILTPRERRQAWVVLVVVIVSAMASAAMVASVFPFLSVLAQPNEVEKSTALSWAYGAYGFTDEYNFLIALGAASFVVIVVGNLLQIARVYVIARYTAMRTHAISLRLLSAYLAQPYEYFIDHHSSEMSAKVLDEAHRVVALFLRPILEVISAGLTIFAVFILLVIVNPTIAFVALFFIGSLYTGVFTFSRRAVARMGQERAEANHERYRNTSEALGAIKDIKLLGCEGEFLGRFSAASHRMAVTQSTVSVLGQTPLYVIQTVGLGGVIALCLVMINREAYMSGTALTNLVPVLGVFAFGAQRLMPELSRAYQNLTQINYGGPALNLVYNDVVKMPPPEHPGVAAKDGFDFDAPLRVERVTYHYPSAERPSLRDINIDISAGQRIGIVGATGAGKTTLVDIVLGLLQPTHGTLSVGDKPIGPGDIRQWQRNVGYVPQEIFLTDASVAENIAFGVPKEQIDLDRVRHVSQIAKIDAFVMSDLPSGYETSIGEKGVRLSGGQRQRLGIARALYRDPHLIVFDEATSALDNLTEKEVMSAIDALPGDKAVVLIAHRLSTVERCDKIALLDAGRIVGYASWAELLVQSDAFKRMVEATSSRLEVDLS
ncbi:ABC transporter ATP-binding protein [Aurantiacibacter rhizosphaerae]|uniref:ABC transporter ATP-binding protein n=1 Tax=Aurantiacibacter rhizosphaerae TaxID=2691582 RepID=UPI0013664408|nr:ABC transporter ATP-binding protein [Aurantiacibacter rhizosphaerae]